MLLASLLVFAAGVEASVVVTSHINPANGHEYYLVTGTVTPSNPAGGIGWSEANAFASSLAGPGESAHLLSITTAQEEAWILSNFAEPVGDLTSPFNIFWMGLSDRDSEGSYIWENGEGLQYQNWSGGGPPVDLTGLEDYVYLTNTSTFEPLTGRGQWNDSEDQTTLLGVIPFSAIVEVEPVPEVNGLAFLAAGLLVLQCRRRRDS